MKNGMCKFCGKIRDLVDSHIIPRSLYPKNENGDIRKKGVHMGDESRPSWDLKNGMSDKEMVCRECEDLFDPYDGYAKQFFSKVAELPFQMADNGKRFRQLKDFDPAKLCIFFLTLLWRAHATTSDGYKNINLGKHEAEVKQIIQSGHPPIDGRYAFMMLSFKADPNPLYDLSQINMTPVRRKTTDGINLYEIWLFGVVVIISVDQRAPGAPFLNALSQPDLYIIERDSRSTPYPKQMWDAMLRTRDFYDNAKANRARAVEK